MLLFSEIKIVKNNSEKVGLVLWLHLSLYTSSIYLSPHMLSPFRGGGMEYLNDPESYADWSFYTPGWASQVRQVEG